MWRPTVEFLIFYYKNLVVLKEKFLENAKRGEVYKKVLEIFPDAELIDIDVKQDEN